LRLDACTPAEDMTRPGHEKDPRRLWQGLRARGLGFGAPGDRALRVCLVPRRPRRDGAGRSPGFEARSLRYSGGSAPESHRLPYSP